MFDRLDHFVGGSGFSSSSELKRKTYLILSFNWYVSSHGCESGNSLSILKRQTSLSFVWLTWSILSTYKKDKWFYANDSIEERKEANSIPLFLIRWLANSLKVSSNVVREERVSLRWVFQKLSLSATLLIWLCKSLKEDPFNIKRKGSIGRRQREDWRVSCLAVYMIWLWWRVDEWKAMRNYLCLHSNWSKNVGDLKYSGTFSSSRAIIL